MIELMKLGMSKQCFHSEIVIQYIGMTDVPNKVREWLRARMQLCLRHFKWGRVPNDVINSLDHITQI